MAAKIITFDEEARRALERGMDQLANAVKIRWGPKAATSSSRRSGAPPRSPTTGCRSPRRSSSTTRFEKIGAELVKEVAKITDDVAGDGTTTATVLAQRIVKEGLRNVAAGANP